MSRNDRLNARCLMGCLADPNAQDMFGTKGCRGRVKKTSTILGLFVTASDCAEEQMMWSHH